MEFSQVSISALAAAKGLIGGPFGSSLVSNDYEDGGVPVIRGTNLGHGKYVGGEFAYVSQGKVHRDLARNTASPGDVVFTQRGTLGQVAVVPSAAYEGYVVSQSQMRLRVDSTIASAEYVYYACTTLAFLKQISDNAISTGVPHINLGILARLKIPLPQLFEQRAIAEVLGALDDKIAANTRLIDAVERLAVSMLSDLVPSIALGEVVNHRKRTVDPDSISEPLIAHFSLPAFDQSGMPELTRPTDIKSSKFAIEKPSVLISKLNPRFPRVWDIASLPSRPALASTEFLVLEPRFSSTAALWAILSQLAFRTSLEGKVSGTSGSHQRVGPDDLLATLVVDPRDLGEIGFAITSTAAAAQTARLENRTLAATRDTLLPQLMSGKLRVKTAEKTLEAVL